MTTNPIQILAFDADDTLWINEPFFRDAEKALIDLLSPYYDGDDLLEKLYQQEVKNLGIFGYGAKGFGLSMIESAIELTQGKITGHEIQTIIDLAKGIMNSPVHLLDGVQDTLSVLAKDYQLMLITKGDLFDQESKIARSGLADMFSIIEIVSEKNEVTYKKVFARHQLKPQSLMMVGNSLKSDVLPLIHIGAQAVHIPYDTTWAHEQPESHELEGKNYHSLQSITQLPDLLVHHC